jgi:hypothetical protein
MAHPQQSKTNLGSLTLKKWAWFIVSSILQKLCFSKDDFQEEAMQILEHYPNLLPNI